MREAAMADGERATGRRARLALEIEPQPTDSTCGPTCLQAVYRYYGDDITLAALIDEVHVLEAGGTLAVSLANHALARGYAATIYTYNLTVFDPTWFRHQDIDLRERLLAQARAKPDPRLQVATRAYLEFLDRGGALRFQDLTRKLIRYWLWRDRPILTGLSATYLYGCARETGEHVLRPDDVAGIPTGHFVVLSGYDRKKREVLVNDPMRDNPRYGSHTYWVSIDRLISAILLGVLTYDANLLVLEPGGKRRDTH
jgi:hypothetical protein